MLSVAERHKYILDHLNNAASCASPTWPTGGRDEGDDPQGRQDTGSEGAVVQGTRQRPFGQSPRGGYRRPREAMSTARRAHRPEAVELLNDNDSIIMASGSTIYAFAEAIKREFRSHLSVVTTFLKTSVLLTRRRRSTSCSWAGASTRSRCRRSAVTPRQRRAISAAQLFFGRRHRSGTRDHHLDDRGGEAHAR